MIYLIYLFLLGIFLFLERKQSSPRNMYRVLIPLIYILLVGFRGANVGTDTATYYAHYYFFGRFGCDFVEKGFDFLNRFCFHMGWNHVPFFCLCAATAIIPVVISSGKLLSRKEYTIFLLLFCTTTFTSLCNGMRQNMACGILFAVLIYAQYCVKNKFNKILLYLLGFLLCSLFHISVLLVSVLIVVPVYLLTYVKLSNKIYLFLYLISFLLVFINVADYIVAYNPILQLGERDYQGYFHGAMTHQSASSLGFLVTSARNLIILILMFNMNLFKTYPFFSNILFLFFILANAGFNVPLVGRLNMYFAFFCILIIAKIFSSGIGKTLKNTKVLVATLAMLTIVLYIHSMMSEANKVRDYSFYWETPDYEKYIE